MLLVIKKLEARRDKRLEFNRKLLQFEAQSNNTFCTNTSLTSYVKMQRNFPPGGKKRSRLHLLRVANTTLAP